MKEDFPPANAEATSASEPAPTRRKLRPRILGGFALCLLAFFINDWRPWEPRYHGAPISHWLEELQSEESYERESAKSALLEIGPNAVLGLARIIAKGSDLHTQAYTAIYKKLPAPLRAMFDNPADSNFRTAAETLILMGPVGKPALPALRGVLEHGPGPLFSLAGNAMFAIQPGDPDSLAAFGRAWLDARDEWLLFDESRLRVFDLHPKAIEYAAPLLIKSLDHD